MGNKFSLDLQQAEKAARTVTKYAGREPTEAELLVIKEHLHNYPTSSETEFFSVCCPERGKVSILPLPGNSILTLDRKNAKALLTTIENAFKTMGNQL